MQFLHGAKHLTKACEVFPCGTKQWISLLAALFIFLLSFYPPKQFFYNATEQTLALYKFAGTGGDEATCDLYNGSWVRDSEGPLYTNTTCQRMPETKNCAKYGKEMDYVNWRWRPHRCELPRFDPERFLNIVRGKKLAFVGDSVARNQMESLLCLLSQVEAPTNVEKDAKDRFVTWYFRSHNFTLTVLWTKFLVAASERSVNGSTIQVHDIQLDKIDTKWAESLHQTDILVISDSHWFFRRNYLYKDGKLIGCTYCSEADIVDLGVAFAIRRAFRTALQFLNSCQECRWQVTVLRTFSPTHFENGAWNGGGYCNRTEPVSEGEMSLSGANMELRNVQVEEAESAQEQIKKTRSMKKVEILDVTRAMTMRPDGHPGSHLNRKWMRGRSDCLHWCMPGPIDMWNELLLAVFKNVFQMFDTGQLG